MMLQLDLCERRGSGYDRAVTAIEDYLGYSPNKRTTRIRRMAYPRIPVVRLVFSFFKARHRQDLLLVDLSPEFLIGDFLIP